MATIFHLALASEWAAAQESGAYTTSTLGRSLAEEGFIHASRADQWTGVRERFYADVTEPLLLLQIDTDLLDVPVVEEAPAPGVTETFPHIYGRLPVSAVVKAIPVSGPVSGPVPGPTTPDQAREPAAEPARRPGARSGASFSQAFLGEMFFNALVVGIAIAGSAIGIAIGLVVSETSGGQRAPGIGGLVGLALGAAVAAAVYRRHHSRAA